MQKTGAVRALVLAAFLISAAHAADYPDEARLFGYQAVPSGSGFSIESLQCGGGQEVYAIVSGGEPVAFLTNGGAGASPITEKGGIEEALYCHYAAGGHSESLAQGFAGIHAEIAGMQGRHAKGEAACRVLLGTDRHECSSFESCLKACYSVTSFCQPIALGAGRAFVNAMWEFENGSRALGRAYADEGEAYAAFAENESEGSALAYLDAVRAAREAAETASYSPLFYDYSFCFAPDYPAYGIYALEGKAEKQYRNASVFYRIPTTAADIGARTAQAMERQARFQAPKAEEIKANRSAMALEEDAEEPGLLSSMQGGGVDFLARIGSFFLGWLNGN
ncbi:MAG: hypothetical protein WC717_02030 [Candidatus Micrarchaeia archaeon]|jgi:hypothetical protein